MRELTTKRAAHPDDLALAMRLASQQLAMGVAEADPRFVGYARGTLAPWWAEQQASPALLTLRARILQAQHDFIDAANDLRAALRAAPDTPDALIVLSAVDEVSGDLPEAKDACNRLVSFHPGLAATACEASVDSLTGKAAASFASLNDAVTHVTTLDRSQLRWSLTILGEIAIQQGDARAEQYLKEALALDRRDVYALTVYADFLLDQGRPAEVLRMLADFTRVDALYLRLAIAAKATGDPNFATYRNELAARFEAARRQGDTLHLRDGSRFALDVQGDAATALTLAQDNWRTHKAPADARTLMAAAYANHDKAAALPVEQWVAEHHLEDAKLAWFALRLAALSPK